MAEQDFVVDGRFWSNFQKRLQDLLDAEGELMGITADTFLKQHEAKSFVPPVPFIPQNSFQVWLLSKIDEHWPAILPLMRDHRRSWWAEIVQQLAEISPAAPIGRVLGDHYNNFARSYFEHQVCSLSWVMKSRRTGEEWPVTRKRPQGAGFMRILGNLVGREEWTRHHPGAPEVPPPSAELVSFTSEEELRQDCDPWYNWLYHDPNAAQLGAFGTVDPRKSNPQALPQTLLDNYAMALNKLAEARPGLPELHLDNRFGRINSRLGQLTQDIEEMRSRMDSDTGHLVELEERVDDRVAELMQVSQQVEELLKAKSEPADAGFDLED